MSTPKIKTYHGPGGLISVDPKKPLDPETRKLLDSGEYKEVRMEGMRILRGSSSPKK